MDVLVEHDSPSSGEVHCQQCVVGFAYEPIGKDCGIGDIEDVALSEALRQKQNLRCIAHETNPASGIVEHPEPRAGDRSNFLRHLASDQNCRRSRAIEVVGWWYFKKTVDELIRHLPTEHQSTSPSRNS